MDLESIMQEWPSKENVFRLSIKVIHCPLASHTKLTCKDEDINTLDFALLTIHFVKQINVVYKIRNHVYSVYVLCSLHMHIHLDILELIHLQVKCADEICCIYFNIHVQCTCNKKDVNFDLYLPEWTVSW